MDYSILIAAAALGVSAIGFFYKLGRDTKSKPPDSEDDKIDKIYDRIEEMSGKVDRIIEWQQTAHGIHEKHGEQIKTLFKQMELVNARLEDRQVINAALQKILERMN